jgi:hypothetical protein
MGNKDQFISASQAHRYYFPFFSYVTVWKMFSGKKFQSSFQPNGKGGHWFALKSEVREHALNSSLTRPEE